MWSRPPFERGNTAALKHGAYSPKVREERAAELVAWLMGQRGLAHIHDPSFQPAVWRWAQRQAMADLLMQVLAEHHDPDPCPGCEQCRGWETRWRTFDRTAERAGVALGLDPQSRADLLAGMQVSGLINAAEDANDLLSSLWTQLQQDRGAEAMARYVESLKTLLEDAGLEVPEPPSDLSEIEADLRDGAEGE